MGTGSTPDSSRTPATLQAVGLTTGCSLPAPAKGHRASYTSNLGLKNSCICSRGVGVSWFGTLPDPACGRAQRSSSVRSKCRGNGGKKGAKGATISAGSLALQQPKPAMKLRPQRVADHRRRVRGFLGKPRAGRKPGTTSTFPQTTDSQGMQHLLQKRCALLCLYSSLSVCCWPPPGPNGVRQAVGPISSAVFTFPATTAETGKKISHPLPEKGMWPVRVTQMSSTHRIPDRLRLESCMAIWHARSGEAEPTTTKQVLIMAKYKCTKVHPGKRRIPPGKQCTSSATTARTRSQGSCRRDAKGQEAQEEKEPCCEAGRRLWLRSVAVPGTARSRPLPTQHRARDALLGQFRQERVPPPPASPAGHSCPHRGGFNFPQKPACSKATPSRTKERERRFCLPVDDPQGFVDGHSPAALLRLPVPLVFGVHVLLREVTAREVKVR